MIYEKMSDTQLLRELGDLRKASFDSMFGHNARVAFNECADVLLSRGITEEPNIFGSIPIKRMA